jgi:hypothetical protein
VNTEGNKCLEEWKPGRLQEWDRVFKLKTKNQKQKTENYSQLFPQLQEA